MRKSLLNILAMCGIVALALSCSGKARVIPRQTMSEIYAEMFVADQWLTSDYKLRRMADTTLIYGGIFEKYGYTVDDYRHSMEYYMGDPDRYARILKQSTLIIEGRIRDLKKEKERLQAIHDSKAASDKFIPERIFFLSGLANRDLLTVDSLSFYIDSTGGQYCFDVQKGYDTLFTGPQLIVLKDTVKVLESVVNGDTLSVGQKISGKTLPAVQEIKFRNVVAPDARSVRDMKQMKYDSSRK